MAERNDASSQLHAYRDFVGYPDDYDTIGAMQFSLLTALGMREQHYLLDIGCGSLRAGKLLIPYLLPGRYFGIEPEQWLIADGIAHEVGQELSARKQPVFSNDRNFTLTVFGRHFDYLLAHSIFSHASQQQIRRCLSQAAKVMTPSSMLAATFFRGTTNYSGDEWVPRGYTTYTLEHMMSLVEEQGLVCRVIDWPHMDQQVWLAIAHSDNHRLAEVSSTVRVAFLEGELRYCRERLATVEGHPYVQFGFRINRFLRRCKARIGEGLKRHRRSR